LRNKGPIFAVRIGKIPLNIKSKWYKDE